MNQTLPPCAMFSFRFGPRYRLLRADSPGDTTPNEDHPSLPEEDSEKARVSEQPATLQLSLWPLIVCLLCTLLNIVLYHLPVPITPASITGQDIWRLRRPSQYIRLDEIARPSPPVSRRFDNYPIVVVQVDSAHQDRVIDGHAHRHMVNSGNILPLEKHVYVSKTVSTRPDCNAAGAKEPPRYRPSCNSAPSTMGWRHAS